jgi:hypothetical protein
VAVLLASPVAELPSLSDSAAGAVATIVGGVVALGGLGSVLASVYFGLAWRLPIAVDYRPLLRDAAPLILLKDRSGSIVDISCIRTRRQAWTVVVSFLAHHLPAGREHDLMERFSDTRAAIGTGIVGSLIALIGFLAYGWIQGGLHNVGWVALVWLAFIGCSCSAHRLAGQSLEWLAGAIFLRLARSDSTADTPLEVRLGWSAN